MSGHPSVVCPSFFHFQMITSVNINGFSPNLVCALILWRSGLGLLMGKFRQIFMELSARDKIMVGYYSLTFLLSHLLVAGCDIGVRFSVRPSVNIYVDVRHLCQS